MQYDYHTHSNYCKHSKFTVESLVEKAIEEKFKEIGISEHIFSPIYKRSTAMSDYNDLQNYIAEVQTAKAKYSSKINILCGLELEMLDPYVKKVNSKFNNEIAKEQGVDFVIHSLHFYSDGKHFSEVEWNETRAKEIVDTYKQVVLEQEVKYIAHPDAFLEFMNPSFDENAIKVAHAIGKLAKENNIILGLNVNGAALERKYPSLEFWKIISQYNVNVKIELDAHSWKPFKEEHIAKAIRISKAANLRVIEKINW